jgi:hypothetical protein
MVFITLTPQGKKKQAGAESGLSLEQRKARDAEIMRLKQESI